MLEKERKKRYGILMCGEDSEYLLKRHGGCYGFFTKMLAEEGETWDLYKVVNGEFPQDDDVCLYDGFVITGSCHDAHANDPWILKLLSLVHTLNSFNKKILGICFGHQIIGRALGGKVVRSTAGWDIDVTTINLLQSSYSNKSLNLPSKLSLFQCHRDEVRDLPEEVEIIGWSEKTEIEMFRYGNHMLGIQGHPEFTIDILFHLIDRLTHRNLIEEAFALNAKVKAMLRKPDSEAWKTLCLTFFKGQL
ncbi:gamma-glutamyl peptidase 5-like [Vicia villosa]|uniref:gamma-glutamyl peptidase 5-like n=1 Tax=Vicia villosa TaxID=3911 RepID=UPI00273AE8D1|nr:gamma-glutamyl peptidase 5-like [Vicia villosa]